MISREKKSYAQLMEDAQLSIELRIVTDQPVELLDFVGQFTALSSQYEQYIKENHPDLKGNAEIFVREMRSGSILADLVPLTLAVITQMDRLLIVEEFIRKYGARILTYAKPGGRDEGATKSDLKDLVDGVVAIANDPNGRVELKAVSYEDGKRDVRAHIQFSTAQARTVISEAENHKKELDHISRSDYERVLMTFTRSDIGNVLVGRKSGERVLIEAIHDKDLALMYASELAEQRIKHEIREADDNIYHKGFVVDVNVQTKGGRPVAYAITDVHQVIDID